jgi:competence protein ComEC
VCGPGRAFHGAWIEVLAPCPAIVPGTAPNDASFVIRLTFGRSVVLLPGDLEQLGESRVMNRLGPITLLKIGHHGSRTSSSETVIDRLRPRVALVSAGHPSPFDHPSELVLGRFAARSIPVLSTAENGAVSVTLRRDGSFERSR